MLMSIRPVLPALGLLLATGVAHAGAPALPQPYRRPPPPPQQVPTGTIDWNDTAVAARGRIGLRLVVDCPAGGQLSSVWGTDVYTDDSSICSAAVHAGFIGTAGGGQVTLEIGGAQPAFPASTRNGVTSDDWGQWDGSFVILSASANNLPPPPTGPNPIAWTDTAQGFAGMTGAISVTCPASTGPASVWGSGVYTDDSSICAAAVHAGAIGTAGGVVDFELRPGEPSYPSTTSNGITTSSWGAWSASFVILNGNGPQFAQPPPIVVGGPRVIGWSDRAIDHRGAIGQQFDYVCPAGGTLSSLWGDGVYTDDSSICTAAVHAGLITVASGGAVTIEMVAGQASYPSTTANGVTSSSWGAWTGSYVVR